VVVQAGGGNYIQSFIYGTGYGYITGSASASITVGNIANAPLYFSTNNTSRALFDTSGHLQILDGNLKLNTSGHGIDFSATGGPTNGTGSYSQKRYEAAEDVENFATHSTFAPYVTTVGLYNDRNQLMAIGKLARAVKNEDDLALSVVVRFDVPS